MKLTSIKEIIKKWPRKLIDRHTPKLSVKVKICIAQAQYERLMNTQKVLEQPFVLLAVMPAHTLHACTMPMRHIHVCITYEFCRGQHHWQAPLAKETMQ